MQAITAYKVLGGWTAGGVIGGVGSGIGNVISIAKTGTSDPLYVGVGGIIASAAAGAIGYMVAQKPNLASAGYAQLGASGFYALISLIHIFTPIIKVPVIAQQKQLSAGKVAGLVEYQVEAGYKILA